MTEHLPYLITVSVAVAGALLVDEAPLGRWIPGALVVLIAGIVFANITPGYLSEAATGGIASIGLPVAIALLLLKANIRRILKEAGTVLVPFLLACVGTVIGVLLAAVMLPSFEDKAMMGGVVGSTLIGGSMNFLAVSEATGFSASDQYAGTLAVDVLLGVSYLSLLFLLARSTWFVSLFPHSVSESESQPPQSVIGLRREKAAQFSGPMSAMVGIAIALIAFSCSGWIANALGLANFALLFLTAIVIAIASLFPGFCERLIHIEALALVILYAFFFVIGSALDLSKLSAESLYPFAFYGLVLSVHVFVLFGAARLFKLDIRSVLIASNASILGPPTAAGMAAANQWRSLVTPALLIGLLGYVLANFIGVGLVILLQIMGL
ncbi:MAG: DUF819 family protein [Henriciella sp.]